MSASFSHATYLKSAHQLRQAPPDRGLEVAFAGRSNAGKSTALNAITGNRRLARTSKTPGRTQLLNFFDLGHARRLVDLPGYGFARVPEKVRRHWDMMVSGYLESRRSLRGLMLVMDIRHPLTDYDQRLMAWAHAGALDTHVLLTKADKLSRGRASATLLQVQRSIEGIHPAATAQLFSGKTGSGTEQARERLAGWLEL